MTGSALLKRCTFCWHVRRQKKEVLGESLEEGCSKFSVTGERLKMGRAANRRELSGYRFMAVIFWRKDIVREDVAPTALGG